MPPVRACQSPAPPRDAPYARCFSKTSTEPHDPYLDRLRKFAETSASTPEEYFARLREAVETAERRGPNGTTLVRRALTSGPNALYMVVERRYRPNLRVTRELFACFFDILAKDARDILGIADRAMRRLRNWAGVSRWPRPPAWTQRAVDVYLAKVRSDRIKLMGAVVDADPFVYEVLYAAHAKAGCSLVGLPVPQVFDAPRMERPASLVADLAGTGAPEISGIPRAVEPEPDPHPRFPPGFSEELGGYLDHWDDSEDVAEGFVPYSEDVY